MRRLLEEQHRRGRLGVDVALEAGQGAVTGTTRA